MEAAKCEGPAGAGVIDAYGHVALPRQMSARRFVQVMDENGVEQAIICTAETCPDLGELARGARAWPTRVRAAGLPIGATARERRENVAAQMAAGFVGIRLPVQLVAREPEVLAPLGGAAGVAIMVGGDALRGGARELTAFLEKHERAHVWAAHFGEPRDVRVLDEDAAVGALFAHPRFAVICSRHSGQDPRIIEPWARLLVERVGWQRLLFGSEYPVAAWRDETYLDTLAWMERFLPNADERAAYRRGNAERMLFARPAPKVPPLPEWLTRFVPRADATVACFPNGPLQLPEALHQRLLEKYLDEPAATRGRYSEFLVRMLAKAAGAA